MVAGFSPYAQDIHFSQFKSAPMNTNPAAFSAESYDVRLVMNHKNQWNSFTNAYRTYSFSLDGPIPYAIAPWLTLRSGLLVNSDRAGDGGLGFIAFSIPLITEISLPGLSSRFSLAASGGLTQYGVDVTQFTFDSQYQGNSFQPDLPPMETGLAQAILHSDWSLAAAWQFQLSPDLFFETGWNGQHLHEPDLSWYGDGLNRLPARHQFYVEMNWMLNPMYRLMPVFYYSNQGKYQESIIGAAWSVLAEHPLLRSQTYGLYLRASDAILLSYHLRLSDYQIGVSYDINVSGLSRASYGRGGFEISLIYWLSRKPKLPETRFKQCPRII